MKAIAIVLCLTSICGVSTTHVIDVDPAASKSGDEFWGHLKADSFDLINFVKEYGYPIEEHNVITEDGYILLMHRIPHGRNNRDNSSRPVVLFMPGLISTSSAFLVVGPEQSLAMQLADQYYDVWIGNSRGNFYSRQHETLDSSKDKEYWNFSFEELGTKDLPAIVDYVLKTTGGENLSLIGHSQGNTEAFIMLSVLPEYNSKILLVVAMGPIAYMNNTQSPLVRLAAENLVFIKLMGKALGIRMIFDHNSRTTYLSNLVCTPGGLDICPVFVGLLVGFDNEQLNRTALQILTQSCPAGTSLKTIIHYGQEYQSGHFRRYDYGIIQNLRKYKTITPPDYNLSKITAPVAIYYGQNDWMSSAKDVERFADQLPNLVVKQKITYEKFSHIDFLMAKDVNKLVYNYVISLINSYNGKEELMISSTSTTTKL